VVDLSLSYIENALEQRRAQRPNESPLMRAVDQAFAGAVAEVFGRMVKDLDHSQLPIARSDMQKRLDNVRTVHAEMRQRVEDLET